MKFTRLATSLGGQGTNDLCGHTDLEFVTLDDYRTVAMTKINGDRRKSPKYFVLQYMQGISLTFGK